jgi:hypothetical protein
LGLGEGRERGSDMHIFRREANLILGNGSIMPNTRVPTQTAFAVQNDTIGQVDYLKFEGPTLVKSRLVDYGLGAEWHIVGELDARELLYLETALISRRSPICVALSLHPEAEHTREAVGGNAVA